MRKYIILGILILCFGGVIVLLWQFKRNQTIIESNAYMFVVLAEVLTDYEDYCEVKITGGDTNFSKGDIVKVYYETVLVSDEVEGFDLIEPRFYLEPGETISITYDKFRNDSAEKYIEVESVYVE